MNLTRPTLVVTAILAAVGSVAACAPANGTVAGTGPQHGVMTDADLAALRICHAALALEHNTFVEYDWNTAWESAANMDADVRTVEDEGIRDAAQAAFQTLPALFEDEAMSDDAFIEGVVPIMSSLYYACEEWSADRLYED